MTAHHFQSMNPIDALFLDLDGTLLDNSHFPESIVGTCDEIAAAQPGLDTSELVEANTKVWEAYWGLPYPQRS